MGTEWVDGVSGGDWMSQWGGWGLNELMGWYGDWTSYWCEWGLNKLIGWEGAEWVNGVSGDWMSAYRLHACKIQSGVKELWSRMVWKRIILIQWTLQILLLLGVTNRPEGVSYNFIWFHIWCRSEWLEEWQIKLLPFMSFHFSWFLTKKNNSLPPHKC